MQVCTVHFTAETELSMRFRAEKRWRSWLKSSFPKSGLNQNIVVFDSQITILRAANGHKSDEHSGLLQNSQTPLQ